MVNDEFVEALANSMLKVSGSFDENVEVANLLG
jgi:hypothetical protein